MTIHFTISPFLLSTIINILLLLLVFWVHRKRQNEPLYNRLSTWYFVCFLIIALGAPILTAMSSLKSWNDLESIQWFVLVTGILVNAANTMSAFITKVAKQAKEGDGIIPLSNGNTQFLTKESPPSIETKTTVKTT